MADYYFLGSRLTSRIAFLKKVFAGRNSDGSLKPEGWEVVKETWAEVAAIGGEESRRAAADSGETQYVITFRGYHSDITPDMRIRLQNGKVIAIRSLPRDPDGRNVYLQLDGFERQGDIEKWQ